MGAKRTTTSNHPSTLEPGEVVEPSEVREPCEVVISKVLACFLQKSR